MNRFTTFVLFCAIVVPTIAFYQKTDVIELTPSNFDQLVIKSHEIWVVEFYVTWSRDCKLLAPEYIKVAEALKGLVKFGAIDDDKYQALGIRYSVNGVPTIKIFAENKQSPIDYKNNKNAMMISDTVLVILTQSLTKAVVKLKT